MVVAQRPPKEWFSQPLNIRRMHSISREKSNYCIGWPQTKVTISPGFSGTVPIFNDDPGKNHNSPGTPICPVFGLVFRICPDLPISAVVFLRIGGQKLAQISSVYTKKSLAAGTLPLTITTLGDLPTLPQTQSWTSDGSRLWRCTLRFAPSAIVSVSRIAVPNVWSPSPIPHTSLLSTMSPYYRCLSAWLAHLLRRFRRLCRLYFTYTLFSLHAA